MQNLQLPFHMLWFVMKCHDISWYVMSCHWWWPSVLSREPFLRFPHFLPPCPLQHLSLNWFNALSKIINIWQKGSSSVQVQVERSPMKKGSLGDGRVLATVHSVINSIRALSITNCSAATHSLISKFKIFRQGTFYLCCRFKEWAIFWGLEIHI